LIRLLAGSERFDVSRDVILARIHRRGRLWGGIALKRDDGFDSSSQPALLRVAKTISECIERLDWERIVEVRARIDRKVMEQLRPKDLFYQILHGLRSLTRYDHSSALLICDDRERTLELVAEQVAWLKGKSRRIGLRLPLKKDVLDLMQDATVYGFERFHDGWHDWPGQEASSLATILDYNDPASGAELSEAAMLCAPLATRDGLLGVLKVSACHAGSFGTYEANLVQRFMPLAAVAIQNSHRTVTLEAKMLEAEKKHAVANLVRGVSHDVNNALGSVLPLVQQILADIRADRLQTSVLADDLSQIEESLQTCRRIFGGMLSLARGVSQGTTHANVRRALDSTLAILRDSIERQKIRLVLELPESLPTIRASQGDLEQLFLNLATNARDAMPEGGALSVCARRVEDLLEVTIRDTGFGIAPEHIPRIQEPFFTTKRNGSGLGLSICRSIIWNVRGEMKIESQQGSGTTIRVILPIVDDSSAAGPS
jgi:two-component system NtrC family sensor kinase